MIDSFIGIFSVQWLIWVIIAVLIALIIIDLVKRHTLSKTGVWYAVTLLIPACFIYSCLFVGTNTLSGAGELFEGSNTELSALGIVLAWLAVLILWVLIATLFIRNNIFPLNKNKTEQMPKEQSRRLAAKRLIIDGLIGTSIYFLIFISILVFAISTFGTVAVDLLIPMLICLLIPIINIISIIYFCFIGAIWVVVVVFALGLCIALIPLMNGCMRYAIISNDKKSMKALWSFLSLIPIFNFGLGIYYLVKIKNEGY